MGITTAPPGFKFTLLVQTGHIHVEATPQRDSWVGAYYWGHPLTDDRIAQNSDGKRWPPYTEVARQHAAQLTDRIADPIRPETLYAGDPRG
ncbi:MAG: hypothetical protein E6R03_10535 [Hyphomicrobiaceae bacterium]|nr:MAG: hypothetical protein E6R03_10535 [Hyphomicrobiaceae bacterium]